MVRLRRSDPALRQNLPLVTSSPMMEEPVNMPAVIETSATRQAFPGAIADPVPVVSAPVAQPSVANKVNVADHPLAQHALMALRNKFTVSPQFRQICHHLLALLTIEATRKLPTRDDLVQTHSTTHTGPVLAKPVVFLSVNRQGLGLAHHMADFFPDLLVGAISLERNGNPGIEPRLHLVNAPALSDARVILFDPVVATGLTASQAIKFIHRTGATDVTLISYIVSFQGLSRLQAAAPDLSIWTAGIDSDWDSKKGPLPGLGNFTERLYG